MDNNQLTQLLNAAYLQQLQASYTRALEELNNNNVLSTALQQPQLQVKSEPVESELEPDASSAAVIAEPATSTSSTSPTLTPIQQRNLMTLLAQLAISSDSSGYASSSTATSVSSPGSLFDSPDSDFDAMPHRPPSADTSTTPKSAKRGYACPICHKIVSRRWYLRSGHMRVHDGAKPYNCQKCNRAFSDKSNMRSHMKICDRLRAQRQQQPSAEHTPIKEQKHEFDAPY